MQPPAGQRGSPAQDGDTKSQRATDDAEPAPGAGQPPSTAADPDPVSPAVREHTRLPLTFARGEADFSAAGDSDLGALLRPFVDALAADPALRLEIGGHASQDGPESINTRLGKQRAEAAARLLIRQGAPADRLDTVSYGATMPVLVHGKPSSSESRRVTIRITD